MEVDYEPLTEGGSMHGPEPHEAEASSISASNSGENAFLPKTIQEECLRLCRPTRYDGRRDVEALGEFLNSLDLYLSIQNAPEEFQLLLASSLLEGEARRWWQHLSNGSTFLEHIRSMQPFRDALRCTFIPSSAREQAMAELRKLEQGKLSIKRYIEKYQSLVNRSPMVTAELHYNWFIAGLEPVVRQTVTGWATDREMRGEKVELADMMEYLRRIERTHATSTALAEKQESGPGNDPDLEPMDIGAWKAQMRSSDGAIEVIPPGSAERVHLSALPTAFASSMVRGVETVSEEKGSNEASPPCRGTEENNGGTRALRHDGQAKTAVLGESIQLTPEERQKWAKLKEEFSDVLNNKELPAGRPPAGRSMHRIELIIG
ncbi:uncharacterized protein EMH_0065470 [Eimeria mitis]|uniref:Retrotransposon gag domain-containing protein n=1 Tax=Eimeria mitis TaxID=44415 RepID=U6K723_9EIME|nr:uncharacterized protein EMH_0065470 [Eimeria mitis]CDJ31273.1 hypothetical protein EMH_0065470 [Eimeria mitis]